MHYQLHNQGRVRVIHRDVISDNKLSERAHTFPPSQGWPNLDTGGLIPRNHMRTHPRGAAQRSVINCQRTGSAKVSLGSVCSPYGAQNEAAARVAQTRIPKCLLRPRHALPTMPERPSFARVCGAALSSRVRPAKEGPINFYGTGPFGATARALPSNAKAAARRESPTRGFIPGVVPAPCA